LPIPHSGGVYCLFIINKNAFSLEGGKTVEKGAILHSSKIFGTQTIYILAEMAQGKRHFSRAIIIEEET
jgi:hypothetical protein